MLTRFSAFSALLACTVLAGPLAGQNFNFGGSIAVSPSEVLIGQPENTYAPGFVYVYRPGPGGTWKLSTKLSAEGASNHDGFGKSIALDGSTALISSVSADSEQGAVFAFSRDPSGAWHQTARLVAPDGAPGDHFGRHLALSGNAAFIASSRNKGAGAVYVFHRDAEGHWASDTVLVPSDSEPTNWYGAGLASAGNRLYVSATALGGAPADSGSGSVYVYTKDRKTGAWQQETRLIPDPRSARAGFGAALLPHGDSLLIGAPGYDHQVGAVFMFARDSSGKWAPATRLLPFDASPRSLFGVALAEVGKELWVGAPGASRFEGRVYRFTRDTAGFTGASRTGIPGLEGQALFGFTMAANASVAVVGVPGQDFQEGGAALFTKGVSGWKLSTRLAGDLVSLTGLTGAKRECTGGKVSLFDCQSVDLMSFLPVKDIGGKRGIELNDIWGYTDPQTHHEYALVGRLDGTSFVDITDASHPVYVGDLPKTAKAPASIWRDIKTYQHYAFIVADGAREHGMQVFDLDRLRHPGKTPVTFTEDAHYDNIHSAHNIVVDTATGYAYLVGGSAGGEMCGGGLHMVDIRSPLHPQFAGCFADSTTGRSGTGYTHDAQCVVYHGPDAKYDGREICFNFSETALGIADVTDKASPKALSHQSYPNVGYAHQGWLTEDQKYVYADDELDEIQGLVPGTRTLIWDVSDLENPVLAGEYVSPNHAIDHNLFVVGDKVYESNYLSGLRVLDITDRLHPKPAGYFDTVPVGPDAPEFGGSWGNYPFFPSGLVAVTSMKEGLFVLRSRPAGATP